MARPNILDGKSVVNQALDESGYNYYAYINAQGEWVIMRENTAQTEYRYAQGGKNFVWANRATYGYGLPA